MTCTWQPISATRKQCSCCGKKATLDAPEPIHHACKSRGLGDTIAKVTSALGIPKCGGCGRRQARLNEMMPYAPK